MAYSWNNCCNIVVREQKEKNLGSLKYSSSGINCYFLKKTSPTYKKQRDNLLENEFRRAKTLGNLEIWYRYSLKVSNYFATRS